MGISHLYQVCNYEIAQVFRQHFNLNVKFVTSLSSKTKMAESVLSESVHSDKRKKQKSILKKMATSNYLKIDSDVDGNDYICKQIEEWMLDRNYNFDNDEHRKLFLKE